MKFMTFVVFSVIILMTVSAHALTDEEVFKVVEGRMIATYMLIDEWSKKSAPGLKERLDFLSIDNPGKIMESSVSQTANGYYLSFKEFSGKSHVFDLSTEEYKRWFAVYRKFICGTSGVPSVCSTLKTSI